MDDGTNDKQDDKHLPINDRHAHIIWFETTAGAGKIKAGVAWEALRAQFGAGAEAESLLMAYYDNMRMLHDRAQRKFFERYPLPVMLNAADFSSERKLYH